MRALTLKLDQHPVELALLVITALKGRQVQPSAQVELTLQAGKLHAQTVTPGIIVPLRPLNNYSVWVGLTLQQNLHFA